MFIETHNSNIENIKLTFVKSSEIQAYPCGRRRSSFVGYDTDGDGSMGEYEGYRIPFDPEARLNTEANNRKHSGLNGFTQTYLANWDASNNSLLMSLGGYLFNVTLSEDYATKTAGRFAFNAEAFGNKIAAEVADVDATNIYANIITEEVHLFSSEFREYYTSILRDQPSANKSASTSIDVLASSVDVDDYDAAREASNYYFAGLSFSTTPLTGNAVEARSSLPLIVERENMPEDSDEDGKKDTRQLVVSLCILERASAESDWQICQPALLPKIEHGTTENSLIVGDTRVQRIEDPNTEEVIDNYNGDLTVDHDIIVGHELVSTGNIITDTLNVLTKTTTKDLEVTNFADIAELETPDATVTQTLKVQKKLSADPDAVATIDVANIITANVSSNLNVQKAPTAAEPAVATVDKADITIAEIDEVTVTEKTTLTGTVEVTEGSTITVTNDNADDAIITNATVTGTLMVAKASEEDDDAQIIADMATMTNAEVLNNIKTQDLESTGTILANLIGTEDNKVASIIATKATIGTISSANITNSNIVETATANVSGTLNVTNNGGTAQANINKATVDYAYIKDTDIDYAEIADTDITKARITNAESIGYAKIDETDTATARINTATIATATVTGEDSSLTVVNDDPSKAKIDNATINSTINVLTTANIHNTSNNAQLNADKVTVGGTFTATTDLADNAANMTVNKAKFTEINGDDINQKIGEGDEAKYYDVPVMFIEKTEDNDYQLKISRINKVNFK